MTHNDRLVLSRLTRCPQTPGSISGTTRLSIRQVGSALRHLAEYGLATITNRGWITL